MARLILGTIAFAVWAPPALVGLPFAALMVATRPRSRREWVMAILAGAGSVALLVVPGHDLLTGFVQAYVVLATAAFVALTLVATPQDKGRVVPARALRASLLAGAAAVVLARVTLGASVWDALRWDATRQASWAMRLVVELQPQAFAVFEPVVRFVSQTVPANLLLQGVTGLALAWQWQRRAAARPLQPALPPFREFRFGDHWVWGLVAAVTVWITPQLAALRGVALNLLLVLGALYLLRGAAIVIALAAMMGVSPAAIVIGGVVATALVVPLLFLIPGLATLGLTDTWLQFRRRFARRGSQLKGTR